MAKKLLLFILIAGIAVAVWYNCKCCHPPKPPHLDLEEWWGPKELKGKQDTSVRTFKVKFKPEMISDLRQRLKSIRSPVEPLEGIGFQYGFNGALLTNWLQYWAERYPFEERQKLLNSYPQYKTNVQGLDIHFIRVKPQVPAGVEVVPLLLMHGWPGSVREFYEVIPLLTRQTSGYNFAFEVIVPSLPGYSFSDAAVRPGLGPAQIGVVMRNLMHRLGFKKYYIQGGDWGAVIASSMAVLFPDEILGHHTNMAFVQNGCAQLKTLIGAIIPSLVVEPHLADRMYPLSSYVSYILEEFGYFHLQATKPDTIGVALTDSPAGLLAYILEKFSTWTDIENRARADGGLDRWPRDALIDNLMLYWSTNSITTSMRLYAESMTQKQRELGLDKIKTDVPTWAIQAKNELFYQPPGILQTKYTNLVNVTVLHKGGHFLAFELPQVFAEDVFRAVKAFRELQAKTKKTEL